MVGSSALFLGMTDQQHKRACPGFSRRSVANWDGNFLSRMVSFATVVTLACVLGRQANVYRKQGRAPGVEGSRANKLIAAVGQTNISFFVHTHLNLIWTFHTGNLGPFLHRPFISPLIIK